MSEFPRKPDAETERERGLAELVERYFPHDKEFVMEMDFDDALGFVYGQLLNMGEDPERVLNELGVTEDNYEV